MKKRMALRITLTGICIILSILSAPAGKSDPVKCHSEWQGKCSQVGYEPYPMIMQVNERKGSEISGILHWPTLQNSKTRFRGTVEGNRISFTEYELTEGGGIALPVIYGGQIIGEFMSGTWIYAGENGTFSMDKTIK